MINIEEKILVLKMLIYAVSTVMKWLCTSLSQAYNKARSPVGCIATANQLKIPQNCC
jgi:hypothetical protein